MRWEGLLLQGPCTVVAPTARIPPPKHQLRLRVPPRPHAPKLRGNPRAAPHPGARSPPPPALPGSSKRLRAAVAHPVIPTMPPGSGPGTSPATLLPGADRRWPGGPAPPSPAHQVPRPSSAHSHVGPHLERLVDQSSACRLRGAGLRLESMTSAPEGGGHCEGERARVSKFPSSVEVGCIVAWQLIGLGVGFIKSVPFFSYSRERGLRRRLERV